MVITDYYKLKRKVDKHFGELDEIAEPVYDLLGECLTKYPYSDPHHDIILANWLEDNDKTAEIFGYNPSSIGNKKGKMTKEIESCIPRRFVKNLNHYNQILISNRINSEELDEEALTELDKQAKLLNLVHSKINQGDEDWGLGKIYAKLFPDNRKPDRDYTMLDIRDEMDIVLSVSKPYIDDSLAGANQDKIRFILYNLLHLSDDNTDMHLDLTNYMTEKIKEHRKELNLPVNRKSDNLEGRNPEATRR